MIRYRTAPAPAETNIFAYCRYIVLWGLLLARPWAASGQPANSGTVSTLAGAPKQAGSIDGVGPTARFKSPHGVVVGADGAVYVADTENHAIRRITAAGVVTTLAGALGQKGQADGLGATARFAHPEGLALDAQGNVYVADAGNHTLRKVTPAGLVSTVAGQAGRAGRVDGAAPQALFNAPHGLAVGADGTVYVADTYNHTIRRISPSGTVTTLAGSPGQKGAGEGPGAQARFFHPSGVAVDADGALYVADNGNQTVRKITPAGEVSTLAGAARKKGSADGLGPAARFRTPSGVAVDGQGHLYVADYVNSTIRHLTPDGQVSTLAGHPLGWGSQDGTGDAARFAFPFGVAVDARGRLYVADTQNMLIRCVE
ncbi:NHL repeat-containing protein [Hymenobacter arizonensis]|uniref:NHL repeat-containing protein n=1 Tax=Hymenobacter arizonensis TaxID=1227077 RepID=A0A1I5YYQ4_HYMAR|nr:NHL repeat-containing protein [Hymenobacter arizonensis]SFQ49374.1 NHL repeat-containing protein [Hymenobacter arizonensis]